MLSAAPPAALEIGRPGVELATVVSPAASVLSHSSVSTILNVSPRLQWDENNGYCGEVTIQAFALYYGTYISQYRARALANGEVLVGVNEDVVLNKLRLAYQQWDYNQAATPQDKAYLGWVKRQLRAGHPVMGALYINGMSDPDYDHIVPFVGFKSSHNAAGYYPDDKLIFYDNYPGGPYARLFGGLCATRAQANRGDFYYYVPADVDYGCAVTGIVDPRHETVPVRLTLDRPGEPDLAAGQPARQMQAKITVSSLKPGHVYTLLRYDDYHAVPTSHFLATKSYNCAQKFIAGGTTQTFEDTFASSACVTYRCVAS